MTAPETLPLTNKVPLIADPLAEALHFLRMEGMFYCQSELTAPWGVDMPVMENSVWFHVMTRGECLLIDATGAEHYVRQGDVIVLPHGGGHRAVDAPTSPTPLVFDIPHDYISRQYAIMRHGGGGTPTDLICGVVQFGHPAARSLVDMLPEVIHLRGRVGDDDWAWLPGLMRLMAEETQQVRPGGEAVVTRLCDILVIQAIRAWINSGDNASQGWIGALRDPQIGQAIAAIHRDPGANWTVVSLADHVSMSRSGFSGRFTELVGQSPAQYLTRWRMNVAVDMLREERLSILAVASQLGYQSEAAFSRAFKRVMGFPPRDARVRES